MSWLGIVGYVALGLAVVAAVVAAVLVVRNARKARAAKASAATAEDLAKAVRESFAKARALLVAKVPDQETRDAMPRLLMLGQARSGKTTLLRGTGLNIPLEDGPAAAAVADTAACSFWLLGRGLVIEAAGRLLPPQDEDQESEVDGFKELIAGLKRDRPGRPIDGLLLTIPCSELLHGTPEPPEERKRKANMLRKRIAEAQGALEMCAPIYLVVTQCDLVTGFESFAHELDPALRQSMLGWSSPHSSVAEVNASWVDEAFASVRRTLLREQSRRFGIERPLASPDEFFLFPTEMAMLGDALRVYVGEIFQTNPQDDPFSLRGIYFAGDGGALRPAPAAAPSSAAAAGDPALPPVAPPVPAGASRPILFAKELFERKIFPEGNIARPSAKAIRRRQRVILGLQIGAVCTALLCGGLLALESGRLEQETASLLPFLEDLSSDLLEMKSEDRRADPAGEVRKARAVNLFKGLTRIETNRLRSGFLPGSWLSSIDGRVENAVSAGYERIILDAFGVALEHKPGPLEAPEQPLPAGNRGILTSLEKTAEFARLDDWLRDLGTFESNVARYDGLLVRTERMAASGSEAQIVDGRVHDVTALAAYLLDHKVEPSYKAVYYRRALARGASLQPFAIEGYRAALRAKSDKLFEALHRKLLEVYSEAVVRADFEALSRGLLDLETGGVDYTPAKLWKLRDAIARVEADLANPAIVWISGDALPPNPGLARLLDEVQTSRLLGVEVQQALKERGDSSLQLLKNDLSTAESTLSGPILARKDNVVQLQLTPFITDLKAPIDALRALAFMSGAGADDALPDDGDDARISWDVDVLGETAKLPKEDEAYLQAGGTKLFDPRVQDTIKALIERTLKSRVLGGVAKAAGRGGAAPGIEGKLFEAVRLDATNLTLASAPLREILASLQRLKMNEVRDRIRALLRGQGGRVFNLTHRLLESPPLYRVRDDTFSWWNGEGVPVYDAFGATDVAALTEYSTSQRARAETLAKEIAEPVLGVMESPEVSADAASVPGMLGFQRVVSPLREYEEKKAGNSVSALEHLLITELPAITFDNCLVELEKSVPGLSAGDFFSEKRRRIRAMLRDRCVELAADDIHDRYSGLRRMFTRDLIGRFPFQPLDPGTKLEDAAPEAVRRFLVAATDFRSRYRGVLARRKDPNSAAVVHFLDKVEGVRAFLAPMWPQAESTADGFFDVKADFRVNQSREVGGNEIAAWSLKLAEERIFLGGPKASSHWRISDPVRFQLRWAKNGPDVPAPSADPNLLVKDRDVAFDEHGSWALFRMIAGHQVSSQDLGDSPDASGGHVLLFVVRTIPDPSGGFLDRVGADAGVVRVFIRLGLAGGEKDKALKYPDFPSTAPVLN